MFEGLGTQHLALLWQGALVTVQICALSVLFGGVLGIIIGLMSTGTVRALRWAAALYVAVIRGVPVLLVIFFVYFGIPLLAPGTSLSEYWAAVIALSVFASAYIGELVRGSIQAVPRGQFEAAEALGLTYAQRMRRVILPQAARVVVPPGVGFLVVLIKDSSLVAVIGLIELTRAGNVVSSLTADPITTYLIVGAGYFVICYALSALARRYERRLGFRVKAPEVGETLTLTTGAKK
ncbi:polar amino acid ABC transporter inner membrane subunit [Mycolicibacterium mageritense DSM 44476 = CIP 104973]|uniref:Amino acid ABC transporter permease n=1 Tax=Mycolicibacterium mageritense TaxID=53462 RepID=A0ABN5YME8_MYCME|nr:amino acid ABC transporter permease [Mycolicibacterium mageritense]MCC9182218.1 amino acid ABC transporter permease [Mycolicibacterium mageritense]BBX38457.1 amino acid ABC transporter permease [Mycolicibacterium mageritense]CDO26810.1 glutamine ABC transporter permease/substrate-binding protein [Mycolicibacterium mageritense DSM 44476 = CIP 104973]